MYGSLDESQCKRPSAILVRNLREGLEEKAVTCVAFFWRYGQKEWWASADDVYRRSHHRQEPLLMMPLEPSLDSIAREQGVDYVHAQAQQIQAYV